MDGTDCLCLCCLLACVGLDALLNQPSRHKNDHRKPAIMQSICGSKSRWVLLLLGRALTVWPAHAARCSGVRDSLSLLSSDVFIPIRCNIRCLSPERAASCRFILGVINWRTDYPALRCTQARTGFQTAVLLKVLLRGCMHLVYICHTVSSSCDHSLSQLHVQGSLLLSNYICTQVVDTVLRTNLNTILTANHDVVTAVPTAELS